MKSKIIISAILLISMIGCSSSNSRKFASEEKVKIDDDYNWIEGLNFDKKVETKYLPNKDEFKPTKEATEVESAIVKESVAALPSILLDEEYKLSDDSLSKIVIQCYQGKFDEAFVQVDKVYWEFKNNTSYWNQVGTCYYLQGDYSKAILFYNKSRDLDQKYTPPLNNLGVVYEKQGKHQKALAAYKKAVEINQFAATPSINLARIYLQYGITSKALPTLLGMQKKSPSDPILLNALATAYLINNDYVNALAIFNLLPKESLVRADTGLNYSIALKFNGKDNEAVTAVDSITNIPVELKDYANRVQLMIKNDKEKI
jgi:tetratricopeptide (TPR) repeat protein